MLSITGICSAGSGLQKAVADWAHVAQFLFVARAKSPGEFIVAKESLLNELLGPVVESMGYTFWGLEYLSQGKDTVLRVFIDHENGITVDDCAAVSRQISSVMDVEDPISQVYNLEVSSPGMDRPVFTLEQYASLAGNIIDVRLRMAFDGRRKFKGQLIGVEQEDIVLRVDDNEYLLPIELIEKANVVPQFKD
jgi:ribosome maturation factor RimP|tara:strand:- start:121 stop:699 length:579 start_codon:yes stop_codon:yes gene_type:complete